MSTIASSLVTEYMFCTIHLQATEEQVKLMQDQSEIESKYGVRVVGLSLFHTVLEVGFLTIECTKWSCQLLKLCYFAMLHQPSDFYLCSV